MKADEVAEVLGSIEAILLEDKLTDYSPYHWQKEFHSAGKHFPERMLMAANRVGKTMCAAAEVAMHLTGIYPDWWDGRRFSHAVLVWVASVSNEASKDIVQKELLGGLGEELGTGWIPKRCIIGKPSMRQAGISDVIDTVKVRHKSGKISTCVFKSHEQGWRKFQGTAPDVGWFDEEAEEYRIFTEMQTRLLTSHGTLLVTFTPLLGNTELVEHFSSGLTGTFLQTATWDDAPHLEEDDKNRLREGFPAHELEARTLGIPSLGEGRIFTVSQDEISVKALNLADFPWYARISGIDFGIAKDHPGAGVWLSYDRDSDTIYVTDCYKAVGQPAIYHAERIKSRGAWIPCAWPHDGVNSEKSGSAVVKDEYKNHGVNMLPMSARYNVKKGGAQPTEPIVMEILERMMSGRFKVFSHLSNWFEEFRGLHRKDGKIVARKDDIMKATFYAVMMLRYAITQSESKARGAAVPLRSDNASDHFSRILGH